MMSLRYGYEKLNHLQENLFSGQTYDLLDSAPSPTGPPCILSPFLLGFTIDFHLSYKGKHFNAKNPCMHLQF